MYRRNGRGRLVLLVFLALSIVIITLEFRQEDGGPLEQAKEIATAIVTPIQRGITTVTRPIGNFFSSLGELGSLRSKNAELKTQLDQAVARIREIEALEEENDLLRDVLDLAEAWQSMERVTAGVIGRGASNYRWTRTIDKGSNDGIRPDMAVLGADGLVGKILEVNPDTSVVLLLIDPEAGAAARTEDTHDIGSVRGNGASEPLSLTLVSPDAEVDVGDRVITSGFDLGIFPSGIPIGVVAEASGPGPELEQRIDVEPYVDFNKLEFVLVLLETGPELTQGERRDDSAGKQAQGNGDGDS